MTFNCDNCDRPATFIVNAGEYPSHPMFAYAWELRVCTYCAAQVANSDAYLFFC